MKNLRYPLRRLLALAVAFVVTLNIILAFIYVVSVKGRGMLSFKQTLLLDNLQHKLEENLDFLLDKPILVMFWWGGNYMNMGMDYKTPNYIGTNLIKPECNVACEFISNPKVDKLIEADAIIFEVSLTGEEHNIFRKPKLFPSKYPHHIWVHQSYETPIYFPIQNSITYMNYIDLNLTYDHTTSQVPVSFTCPWGGTNLSTYFDNSELLYGGNSIGSGNSGRRSGILFFNGNCELGGAAHRTDYVAQLMEHIHIDSIGPCLKNSNKHDKVPGMYSESHGDRMRAKIEVIKNYKFLLAFENSNVADYVSEKLGTGLLGGAIPVYMGAPNVDEWIPHPSAIIRASQFNSPRELANYLKEVDSNETLYKSYFQWKKYPMSHKFFEKFEHCIYKADCRLCNELHRMKKRNLLANKKNDRRITSVNSWPKPQYFTFNGATTIKFPSIAAADLTKEFTICLWIRIETGVGPGTTFPGSRLVDTTQAGRPGPGFNFDLFQEHSRDYGDYYLRLCSNAGCISGNHRIPYKTWTHVGVSVFHSGNEQIPHSHYGNRNREVTFFVNGEAEKRVHPLVASPDPSGNPLVIGGSPTQSTDDNSLNFKGDIDEVTLWSSALTQADVRGIMFRKFSQENYPPNLHFYAPLDRTLEETIHGWDGTVQGIAVWGDDSAGKPMYLRPSFDSD